MFGLAFSALIFNILLVLNTKKHYQINRIKVKQLNKIKTRSTIWKQIKMVGGPTKYFI